MVISLGPHYSCCLTVVLGGYRGLGKETERELCCNPRLIMLIRILYRETELPRGGCVCVCRERCKEIAHAIMEAVKLKICRVAYKLKTQGRTNTAV